MKWLSAFCGRGFYFAILAPFMPFLTMSVSAQQGQAANGGIVEDWTHHHVIFSNPGTEEEAIANGKHEEWLRIVNNRRYLMQQIRRNYLWAEWRGSTSYQAPAALNPSFEKGLPPRGRETVVASEGKWTIPLTASASSGIAIGMYPAKYTFSPIAAPNCTNDFVVYPINVAGSATQANILGVNNLYTGGTCPTGTVPNALFAYHVGSGVVQTSPVLSEDGTKVAFVESINQGSKFHVLLLDKSGNAGCAASKSPCNGTAFSSPATPGTNNAALDMSVTMSGNVGVTISSPFVDYEDDVAYVGDDVGVLHKFTPVFNATASNTPKEVLTGGWPFTVAAGAELTGPVYDGGASQSIFVGSAGSAGVTGYNFFGIDTTGTASQNGGMDGQNGFVYSSNLLGTAATYTGTTLTFGPANGANVWSNTTITLPSGQYTALKLLATAVDNTTTGLTNQVFTVNYVDGTTSTFTQSLSDWGSSKAFAGETIVVSNMATRLNSSGSNTGTGTAGPWSLYGYTFALTSTKTVKSLTLPSNTQVKVLAYALTGGTGVPPSKIFCVTSAGAACSTPSITLGTGNVDAPIVDSSSEMVFALTNTTAAPDAPPRAVQVQMNTAFSSTASVAIGTVGLIGPSLYHGAFDNAYFNNPATGHLYVCGNLTGSNTLALWSIGFNSSNVMNTSTTTTTPFQLAAAAPSFNCSPLTEIFNPSANSGAGQDLLFLSVPGNGFSTGTLNCGNLPCIMSFDITSGIFPTAAHSVTTFPNAAGAFSTSGIVIDNVSSGTTGAAQIYFGNLQSSMGEQLSQAGLQ
jgi:hypothetical protein